MNWPRRRTGWRSCGMTTAAGRARRRSRRRSSCPTGGWMRPPARVFRLLPVNPGPDVSTAAAAVLADLPVGRGAPGAGGAGRGRTWPRPLPARRAGGGCMTCCACTLSGYLTSTRTPMGGSRPATGCSATTWTWQAPPTIICGRCRARRCRKSSPAGTMPWPGWMRNGPAWWPRSPWPPDTGRDQVALRLPLLLAEYLSWRRRFDDWIAVTTISLDAARRLGDRRR